MVYRFLDVELEGDRYVLGRGGEPVRLGPKVLDLLLYLARQRDRSLSFGKPGEQLQDGLAVTQEGEARSPRPRASHLGATTPLVGGVGVLRHLERGGRQEFGAARPSPAMVRSLERHA